MVLYVNDTVKPVLTEPLIGTNFYVRNRQVFALYRLN
jgi:hypothetical protein